MGYFTYFFKYIFILAVFTTNLAFAQGDLKQRKSQFSAELKKEIYPYLHANVYKEGKRFMDYFNKTSNPKVDKKVMHLMSDIKRLHLSVSEDYYPFFKVFNAYYSKQITKDQFIKFIKFSGLLLQNNRISESRQIVYNLADFLDDKILHKSTNYTWLAKKAKWEFDVDLAPFIRFEQLDLICEHQVDQFKVSGTKGVFNLLTKEFTGEAGQVHWPQHKRYVNLKEYALLLNQIYFEAKGVELIDPTLQQKSIQGTFSHRMSLLDETWRALEPQFVSHEIIPIKNYYKDVNIQSGIHIKGNQIDLIAPKGKSSKIEFIKDGKPFVHLDAQKFTLENGDFFARESMFILFLKGDTISHPSIDLAYDLKNQKLHAKTSDNQFGRSPFYNGLHELQIVADHLYWEKEKNNLIFQNNQTSRLEPVQYQSLRFFDKNWFIDLFNFDNTHPTSILWRLCKKHKGVREFYIEEIQEVYKFSELSVAKELMIDFTNQGFVNFNPFEGKVYVQDRFFTFVTALQKNKDFDRIRFKSKVNNRPSGIIDLETGILTIQAVTEVPLSIKNDVTIYPEDKILHVYPNLDMEFNGSTMCGKYGFFGKNQKFNYDLYEVQFNEIDSFRYLLDIANVEDTGLYIHPCKTVLQEFTGVLEIDHPKNKSSKRKTKAFPIIKSTAPSYVYYDRVKGGLYDKERFHFEVDPFLWNTVLVLKTEEHTFPGVLKSGGIFPDIRETLVLNENEELGFVRDTKETYELNSTATYNSYLRLTNSGLYGKGLIRKDDMVFTCDSIDFYPDYLFAHATQFNNHSSRAISPNIGGKDIRLDWFVDEEWMEVKNQSTPFAVNSSTQLNGGVEYDMNQYYAYGSIVQDNVVLKSDSIELERPEWRAFKSHMKIYPENVETFYENETVLENTTIDLEYNYNQRQLINQEDEENHKFHSPLLKYNFTYPLFTYEMGSSEIYFEPKEEEEGKGYLNITESLNPFTGNVKYISPTSIIEMNTLEVVLVDVEGVQIADALIRPSVSELRLLSSGLPEKLTEAHIDLLDHQGQLNYTFQNAEVSIISGDDYLASADFVFKNRKGDEQIVSFESLAVNDEGKTFGETIIEETLDFKLDPQMQYKGEVKLDPKENPRMILDGEILFNDPCIKISSEWYTYQDSLVDDLITIQNYGDKKLEQPSAAFVYKSSDQEFQVLMANQEDEKDQNIVLLGLEGNLEYADSLQKYTIDYKKDPYSFAHYSPTECAYELEGFTKLSHHILVEELSYSRFVYEVDQPDSLVFQSHFGLDLPLPKKALKIFRKDVSKQTKSNETTFEDSDLYRNFLYNLIGEDATSKYFKAKRRGRNYVPTLMQKTIFFTDVDFVWNSETKYFEHKLGLEVNQIEGKKIDRIIDGYIRYRPGKNGDKWYIYIQLEESDYYYFEIDNDVIYTYSSNQKYVQTINNKKKDLKKKKTNLFVQLFPYADEIPKNLD